jgi:hypothetical protein
MDGLGRIKAYPLSDTDIRTLLGQDISIITYPELADMSDINECFDKQGRCILLFLTSSPTSGHWCCLLRRKDGIEFFDPYGEPPDAQKKGADPALLLQMDSRQPYLSRLLRDTDVPVHYNHHPFQKEKSDVNTCGRHSVIRCLFHKLSLKKYAKMIKDSGETPDNFVSRLTYEKLRK